MSNYKIAFLQKLWRFQDRFKCKPLFCDKIRYFHAKNYRKNSVSNYKITIILKIRGFLGQLICQSLYNDKIRHIYAKNDKKKQTKNCCQITNLL